MSIADRDSARVLVHAPVGRDAPASVDLLRRAGLSAEICLTFPQLIASIAAGAAAVFVAEEGLFAQDLSPLYAWVENQPAWSDLPFVVLTSHREHPTVAAWRQRLVVALRNVSLLERPVQAITLTSTVQSAVRARQRQYEVCTLLEAREQAAQELEALVVARTSELEEANRQLQRQMAERAQVEESLRQAQKIEAIGQLTGGVAHDFNNLLMVVSGGLEMLDRQTDPKRRQRLMDGMRQAAQRGAGLTRQLLAFSRRQPLAPEPVDLARQIGAMRELLDRSLRGDVHVRLEFTADLWPVEVDPGELELVILNLAVNARDAMPEGGTIVVRGENAPTAQTAGRRGDFVRLSVVDTGTGMPPEVRARVFEPFFTTKDVGKGSGLGLAQVHGFATQSGGTVRIESEAGQGTTVTLILPRSQRTPAVEQRHLIDLHVNRPETASSGCVLLVEDDDEVASLVGEMLAQLGYEVTRASSAKAALGALANGRTVDVVVSDIMMPGGMNGVDLARELRRRRVELPVLLTSGYAEAAKQAADAEGIRILPKPYLLGELAAALQAVRDQRPSGWGARRLVDRPAT
jgi:signal transduction histidine kinase/CheY-like chemotaxis protein